MPNIPFLPVLVIIISTLSAIKPVYCHSQTNDYNNFSLGTFFGAVYGHSEELVYPTNTPAELYSELLYDMKPVLYAGIQVEYGRTNLMRNPGVFASLVFKAGIPGDSGIMEDRDWLSTASTDLTNYSRHTNMTRSFYWLDLHVGAVIPFQFFYIKPFLSGSWMHFAFTARDGYKQYANESGGVYSPIEDAPIEPMFGDVIRYQQDWLVPAAGISAGTDILAPFYIDLSFQISPLAYCSAIDEHLKINKTFLDFSSFGFFIEPKINLLFCLDRFDLSLEASYRSIGRTRGESFSRYGNSGAYARNGEAGAALSLLSARFLVRIWF
ncbi:MAG: omptin family outer membrane protease [Treponema sp.]|nr:omptin family outer membrane protease [Treponema sp.]MCL2236663.1 omptin family outer membrane protease [Treponema sp.]